MSPASVRAATLVRVCVALVASACAVAAADTLLVVRKSADALEFVDPGSGLSLASVAVGHAPHEVARSPDGQLAAVTNYGTRDQPGSTLSVIDLENPRELRRIDLGENRRPHGVAWLDDGRIAVTSEQSRRLLIVDPRAAAIVAQIDTGQDGSHMVSISPDQMRAFVTNLASGSMTAIDLVANRKLADVPTGAGSEAIAISPDGREVWVAAREAGTITVVDARTLSVIERLTMPGGPIRIAMTLDGTALVSCAATSEVVALDMHTRREIARRGIEPRAASPAQRPAATGFGGAVPVGLQLLAQRRSAFVAATAADRIIELGLPGLETLRVVEVAGEPDGMALTPLMPKGVCHACEAPPDPLRENP
jgi:YVTN family beta-propeller protein